MDLDLKAVEPRADGKYSPLLHKYLRREKTRRGVFQRTTDPISGEPTTAGVWSPSSIFEGSICTLVVVFTIGYVLVAATPAELYQPAPATHHPTPEGGPAQIQNVQMPPCGPGKDCSELDDGVVALLPHFGPSPTPNVEHNTNQVPEPGTLALIGAGIALIWRKTK